VSSLIVGVHAWLRWFILLAGAVACVRSVLGWARGSAWSRLDDRLSLAFAVSIDIQWMIGMVLYLGVSALGVRALASEGAGILRSPELRFWALVHPVLASGALALAHAGRIRMRTISVGPARHRTAALFFGGALALLAVLVR
jgi:hypothetical protein